MPNPVMSPATDVVANPVATAVAQSVAESVAQAVAATPVDAGLGFGHVIGQSDAVGKALLAVLLLMSVASWALILVKGIGGALQRRHSRRFLDFFWNARSLDAVQGELQIHGVREPFGHLAAHALQARDHHARHGAARLEEAGSAQDFITRTIRKVLDEEGTRLENGLTLLATIGATAPFVGLFGTVWGVYHALVAIGMSGAGSLDQVAGPVGEALIMTGLGLAVAIPAVMAYNAFSRANRVLNGRLDAYAFELMTFLSTGSTLAGGQAGGTPAAPSNGEVRAMPVPRGVAA
ncbi:MotA/TolQ/ExbB proton channel family protein [Leptothrix discophora]|uniref:Biopolymer transport protein ExbB n=1 Tax=Leptothrix discophora TaxID=89 RepID=A0ABT9G4X8_LEPDI|nr:MotA/TolQ/ExbB proton channel family protein [Leptothrix discophora]MDP4301504.1 MotA/TolQ/ExbB proton channel family protein [Leptothrix discophora]